MVNNLDCLHFPGSKKVSRNPGKFRGARHTQQEPELYGFRGSFTHIPDLCHILCWTPPSLLQHQPGEFNLLHPTDSQRPCLQAHTLWKALLVVANWAHIAVFCEKLSRKPGQTQVVLETQRKSVSCVALG